MKRVTSKVDDFINSPRDKVMYNNIDNNNASTNNSIIANNIDSKNNIINDNDNTNNIAIAKKPKKEDVKLCAYRLPVSIIKKIETLSKKSNMGINEFVIKLLSETLDKIKIEE